VRSSLVPRPRQITFADDLTLATTKVHAYEADAYATGNFGSTHFYVPACEYNAALDAYYFSPMVNHWVRLSSPRGVSTPTDDSDRSCPQVNMSTGYSLIPDDGTVYIHTHGNQPFPRVPNYPCHEGYGFGLESLGLLAATPTATKEHAAPTTPWYVGIYEAAAFASLVAVLGFGVLKAAQYSKARRAGYTPVTA